MFRVVAAVDLALGAPSVLIPVFLNEKTNIPYAQVMDEYLMIEDFSPFYAADEYPCVPIGQQAGFVINGPGAVVYRDAELMLHCGTIEDVYRYLDGVGIALDYFPLLKLQMLRLVPASHAKQYDAVLATGHFYFREPDQRGAWSDAALEMIQNNDQIWKSINAKASIHNRKTVSSLEAFEGLNYEELFEILSSSFQIEAWEKLWHKLFISRPDDERLLIIAQKWIFMKFAPGEDCMSAFNVFCAVVDRMSQDRGYDPHFRDFLLEHTSSLVFFSDAFPIPSRIKKSVLLILKENLPSFEYRDLILNLLNSNYFDVKDSKILGLELSQNLEKYPMQESSTDVDLLRSVLSKIQRYQHDPEFSDILKSIKYTIRSRSKRIVKRP